MTFRLMSMAYFVDKLVVLLNTIVLTVIAGGYIAKRSRGCLSVVMILKVTPLQLCIMGVRRRR